MSETAFLNVTACGQTDCIASLGANISTPLGVITSPLGQCTRAHRNFLPDIDTWEEAYTVSDHGTVFDYDFLRSETIGSYQMRPRSEHDIVADFYKMIVPDAGSSTRPVDTLSDLGTQHS
jgi:hypothetical protein